ncbi:MAG: hypothetical protein JST89_04095 [Cyanobacteria bacterium SZAS-4]|nr:hypothetical protein [Cyanobacteria bacterium SZAS-4]
MHSHQIMWFKKNRRNALDRSKLVFGLCDDPVVQVFESLESAQSYIEPPDVDVWKVYTVDGKVIDVILDGRPTSFWSLGIGTVRLVVTEKFAKQELEQAILDNLKGSTMTVDSGASLESLIDVFLKWNTQIL